MQLPKSGVSDMGKADAGKKAVEQILNQFDDTLMNTIPDEAVTRGREAVESILKKCGSITCKRFSAIANNYYEGGFKELLGYEVGLYRKGHYKTMDRAYSEAFKSLKDVLEHKIPKILSLFESVLVFVANEKGIDTEIFSLSRVRRYYETGVKSLLGEALIEYGFPTDAIRRIEETHGKIKSMTVTEAKDFCRHHFREIQSLLDTYEWELFIKAMRTF